jgi:gamma-glutamylcyclotransferase
MNGIRYYFAYGSNMSPQRMNERLVGYKSRSLGILYDFELTFNKINHQVKGAGYANIIAAKGKVVEGVVYEIDKTGLQILDGFEGYPNKYTRELLPVKCNDSIIESHVYIAQLEETADDLMPEIIYLQYLLDAKDLLSAEYYYKLESIRAKIKGQQ